MKQYCKPLQNIPRICSYITGLHIHNPLFTAKFCSKVFDINTKLIKTQFSLQESLQRNTSHVETLQIPQEAPKIWTKHFWIQFIFRYICLQKIQIQKYICPKIHLHRQYVLQPTLFIPHQFKIVPKWYPLLLLAFLIQFSKNYRTSLI